MRTTCNHCGADTIRVRDDFTGASFAVNAEPETIDGFELADPPEGERLHRARLTTLAIHLPHHSTCPGEPA